MSIWNFQKPAWNVREMSGNFILVTWWGPLKNVSVVKTVVNVDVFSTDNAKEALQEWQMSGGTKVQILHT